MIYLVLTMFLFPTILPFPLFLALFPTIQSQYHGTHSTHHQSQAQTKREESTDLKLLQDIHGEICSLQNTPNFDPITNPEVREGKRLSRINREERWKIYREKTRDDDIAEDLRRSVEEQWEGGWGGDPSGGRQGRVVELPWRG